MEWSLSDLRDVADVLESGEYYLEANVIRKFASDVADLEKRVLPYIKKALRVHQGYEMPTDKEENLIAELEQIVEESA